MATSPVTTGAPARAPFVRSRSGARDRARLIPMHRRKAIEAEIELHLQRATLLIARLDRADAPTMDMEDDDPAGDPLDRGEAEGDHGRGLLATLPRYAVDQSAGPLNQREAEAVHTASELGLVRTERGWRRPS